jgi:hypothetical protein
MAVHIITASASGGGGGGGGGIVIESTRGDSAIAAGDYPAGSVIWEHNNNGQFLALWVVPTSTES